MEERLSPVVAANGWAVAAFLVYLVLLITIGALSARFSSKGIGNFFVGGRSMNRWVVALSAVVSGRSAWLLLGVTGMAWTLGLSAIWTVLGYTVTEFLLFLTMARRIRRFAGAHDCVTIPDIFAERLGDHDGRLRLALSLAILAFMTAYVSAQFVGGGKAMAASFGMAPGVGIVLTALIVLGYTTVGGFMAVAITDTLQAGFMILALLVIPVAALLQLGGVDVVGDALTAYDPSFLDPMALSLGSFVGMVGIGIGAPGNPHILVRYIAIGRTSQLRFAAWTAGAANLFMGLGAVFIGLVGRVWIPEASLLPGGDTENLYPTLARETLHPAFFGVVVASIFAAIMSTADSQLLVGASAVVRDLYEKVFRKGQEVSDRQLVVLSRLVVTLLVLAALFLGWVAQDLVFWLVLFAWAGLGAALGPALLLTMYWKRTTRAGALAGVVAGALVTVVWYFTPELKALVYELIPGFLAGTLATVGVSLITRPPEGVEEMFELLTSEDADD